MTQKHGTGQCPEREWLLGGSELRGMLRCVPGVVPGMAGGQPSWQGGNGGSGRGACIFRRLMLRNEGLPWLPASPCQSCQMSSWELRAWSRIRCFSPVRSCSDPGTPSFKCCCDVYVYLESLWSSHPLTDPSDQATREGKEEDPQVCLGLQPCVCRLGRGAGCLGGSVGSLRYRVWTQGLSASTSCSGKILGAQMNLSVSLESGRSSVRGLCEPCWSPLQPGDGRDHSKPCCTNSWSGRMAQSLKGSMRSFPF